MRGVSDVFVLVVCGTFFFFAVRNGKVGTGLLVALAIAIAYFYGFTRIPVRPDIGQLIWNAYVAMVGACFGTMFRLMDMLYRHLKVY